MKETLFTRLASYSQNPDKQSLENFTTEVLVYLINNDRKFRGIFVGHIIRDGRIRRRFKNALADSQHSFGNGIVDIVLTGGSRRVLVEVKITAGETETKIHGKGRVSQIQKYLNYKAGCVAYLTTLSVGTPVIRAGSKRFLGQTYFEELYSHLDKAKSSLTDCGRLFLEFMKEKNMKSIEPFTKQDLFSHENAFSFAKKCEKILNEIRSEIEPGFQRIFRSRARFTSGHFSPTYESAYIYTKGKISAHKKVKKVVIYIQSIEGVLEYGAEVRLNQSDVKKLMSFLDWPECGIGLYSSHSIKPNMKTAQFVKKILTDLEKMKQALKRAF